MATLLYHWKLDEGTGQYALSSATANTAALYTSTPGDRGVAWTAGGYKGAGLDGDTTSGVDTGALAAVTVSQIPTNLTVACWINAASGYNRPIVSLVRTSGSARERGCALFMDSDGYIGFSVATGAGTTYALLSPSASGSYADSTWCHVAGTIDSASGMLRLFGDCTEEASIDRTPWNDSNTLAWHLCGGSTRISGGVISGAWPGLVDDIRIYDGALTASEICAVMQDFAPPPVRNAIMFSCNT